jgi:cellulose synthase/poly-beta-1,6-N-acetylglucosamine synthase-like glycosyltransferase
MESRPVFADPSGRRRRIMQRAGLGSAAAIARSLAIPHVRVVRQANTGKPGALNRGIAEARSEILVLVDGDTVFQADTLGRLIAPLAARDVGAVSGNTKVGNRRGLLGAWQHLEYVMGFNLDRRLFDLLGTIPTVPGAIGAFRRAALTATGGVSADTLGTSQQSAFAAPFCASVAFA